MDTIIAVSLFSIKNQLKVYINAFLLLVVLTLGGLSVKAQTKADSSIVQLSGYVIDSVNREPVSFITIHIRGSNRGMISNNQGFFSLAVNRSDTVVFTGVGYRPQQLVVGAYKHSPSLFVSINMLPSIYMLKGITVRALTKERFRYEFLHLELPVVSIMNPAALIKHAELNLPPSPPGIRFSPSEIISEIPFVERAVKKKRSKKFVDEQDPSEIPVMK